MKYYPGQAKITYQYKYTKDIKELSGMHQLSLSFLRKNISFVDSYGGNKSNSLNRDTLSLTALLNLIYGISPVV